MERDDEPQTTIRQWMRWATTPPQAYAVYLVALLLVFTLSFYAGTMKPKGVRPLVPMPAAPSHG
jgi:hypothetical protein